MLLLAKTGKPSRFKPEGGGNRRGRITTTASSGWGRCRMSYMGGNHNLWAGNRLLGQYLDQEMIRRKGRHAPLFPSPGRTFWILTSFAVSRRGTRGSRLKRGKAGGDAKFGGPSGGLGAIFPRYRLRPSW